MPTFEVKPSYIDVKYLGGETGLYKYVLGSIYAKENEKIKQGISFNNHFRIDF